MKHLPLDEIRIDPHSPVRIVVAWAALTADRFSSATEIKELPR